MRVNLTKYGWVKNDSERFGDDGAYFDVYRNSKFPDLRLTKCLDKSYGYFIDICIRPLNSNRSCLLTINELRNLPHYQSLSMLNNGCYPTDDDIKFLMDSAEIFYDEYTNALEHLTPVDEVAVKNKIAERTNAVVMAYNEAHNLVTNNFDLIMDMPSCQRNMMFDYLKRLKNNLSHLDKFEDIMSDRAYAMGFINYSVEPYTDNYYYRQIAEYITISK